VVAASLAMQPESLVMEAVDIELRLVLQTAEELVTLRKTVIVVGVVVIEEFLWLIYKSLSLSFDLKSLSLSSNLSF